MVQAHMILAVVPQMGMSEHLKTHSGCRDGASENGMLYDGLFVIF